MPSVTFLTAALLFSCLATRAETVSYKIPVNDLWSHCSFDLNGYVYNLCPIMGSSRVVDVPESQGGRSGSGRYVLALGGVVNNPGCDEETWVCSTKVEGIHERSRPVVQNGKSSNLIVEFRGEPDHGPSQLQISLHGAKKDLDIAMLCSEVEQVELINVGHGGLQFIWASRHGCPRNSTRREPEPTLNTWTNGEQEPNGDDSGEEEELLPSDSRKARKGIAFVIMFIVLSVICGSALVSSTRARHFALGLFQKASYVVAPVVVEVGLKLRPVGQSLNSLASKAISGVRFRTSGDNLVRWAQEDMALESDIMVNGSASARAYRLDEESWDGSDEYIPLATSRRFGTGARVPSYGSTPDHEGSTLREGAVMDRMRRYFKI